MQPNRKRKPGVRTVGRFPLVVTLVYVALGAAWIVVSDTGLAFLGQAGSSHWHIAQTIKGLAFVLLTGVVLYGLILYYARALTRATARAEEGAASQRATASLLQALIDAVPAVVSVKDREGRYVIANEHFARLFGCRKADMVGRRAGDFFGPEATAAIDRLDRTCFEEGRQIGPLDMDFIMPRGDVSSWLTTCAPLRGPDASVELMAAVAFDVTERKRAQDAMRQSEERYRLLFHDSPVPMWVYDRETLAFLEANAAAVAQYGYSRNEFLAMTIRDIRPPDDIPAIEARVRSFEPGLRHSGVWRHRRKDGSLIDVDIHAHTISYLDRPAELVQVNDVTARKRAEEALRDSEERYRLLFEKNPSPMWVYDRETLAFLEVNDAAARHYGYSRDEFLGMTIRDIRMPEDIPALEADIRAMKDGLHSGGQRRHRKKDGTVFVAEVRWHSLVFNGRPALFALVTDVTDRVEAEAERRRSDALRQSIIDAVPGVLCARDRQGRITFLNKYEADLLGVSRDAAVGRTVDEISGPGIWPWRETDEEVFRSGRAVGPRLVASPPTAPSEVGKTWLVVKTPLLGAGGGVDQVVVFGFDMTEQRRLEERLRHAQKLEAIGHLTGGVAHDFNNMLGVITGNLELLRLDAQDVGAVSLIDMALEGASRAADLTRHLLVFSRSQTLQPQPIDVGELLRRLRTMLRRTLGEDIEVVTNAEACRWQPLADAAELDTAILNLAINARDAMPNGGRLTISADDRAMASAGAMAPDVLPPGDYVVISVADTGTGIPKDVLDHIFEPFFTTKEVGKGTGLGLSMVYGFVKQSGGDVRVTSAQGVGTTIELYLPRAMEPALDKPESDASTAPMARPGETVLLVEDDAGVRDLSERLLGGLGYTVRTAPDGPSAVAILEGDEQLDLMLTDVVMPRGMTGLDVAVRAHALRPGLKVLFMSGYADGALGHVKLSELGDRLMQKPFRRASLARALRDALDARD